MSELARRQQLFTRLLGKLLVWIFDQPGYTASIREVQRSPQQAMANAVAGIGIKDSLHLDSLAADIMLYRDGKYLTRTEDYKPAGDYWLTLDPLCRWGGCFANRPDGNHFSITYQGRC